MSAMMERQTECQRCAGCAAPLAEGSSYVITPNDARYWSLGCSPIAVKVAPRPYTRHPAALVEANQRLAFRDDRGRWRGIEIVAVQKVAGPGGLLRLVRLTLSTGDVMEVAPCDLVSVLAEVKR